MVDFPADQEPTEEMVATGYVQPSMIIDEFDKLDRSVLQVLSFAVVSVLFSLSHYRSFLGVLFLLPPFLHGRSR